MLQDFEEAKEIPNIRHQLDGVSGILYLSIVDIIEMLGLSSDPRNYWKTLKNRLKSTQNKLVTKCNQLKMRASDGKMYLTDTIDADNMLLLVQQIAPEKVGEFRRIFRKIETESATLGTGSQIKNTELSTEEDAEYKLGIDAYVDKDIVIIRAMLAGVDPENVSIIANCNNILIKGKKFAQKGADEEDYIIHELAWGKFSREITMPEEVNIEEIETKFTHGMLKIKIPKIDKTKTKIIKLKY